MSWRKKIESYLPLTFFDFCVLLATITLITLQLDHFADDPGVGWHLRTGEFIAAHHQIPDYDPFLAAGMRRPWISDQWLSDLVIFLLHNKGSWVVNYGVFIVVYLLTFFGVVYSGVKKVTGAALLAAVAALLAFKLAQLHFIFRAAMFGFLFFSYTYVLLYSLIRKLQRTEVSENQGDTPPPLRQYWGFDFWFALVVLPLMFALWANMHPSFILGLILLFLAPLSLSLDRVVRGRPSTPGAVSKLLLLAVFCVLATFFNPYVLDLHWSILSLGQNSYFMSLHEEWMSPNFKLPEGEITLIFLGLIASGIFLGGTERLKWGFFEFLLVGVFGYFGLTAVRMLPYFGIAATVPLVLALMNLNNAYVFQRGLLRRFLDLLGSIEGREQAKSQAVLLLVVCGAILISTFEYKVLPFYSGPFGPSPERYPYEAIEALEKAGYPPHPAVVFAPPEWGGFITLMGAGSIRAIIDDRNTLLGESFYQLFYSRSRPGPAFVPYVRSLGATHILINSSSPLVHWLQREGVKEIFKDPVGTLFELQEPQ